MSAAGAVEAQFASWVGRTEEATTLLSAEPLVRLAATLDCDNATAPDMSEVPALWHWVFFLPHHATRELGPDGHAARGGFLPPVPLPRRMWAGGRLTFLRPLRVGARATRISRVTSVTGKSGRSGALVFVLVRHEIFADDTLALVEEQDLVYRGVTEAALPEPLAAPSGESRSRRLVAHDPLLFRYSALTFNTHRIHYDRRYVLEHEGYPGLVVHGPLIATLLAEQVRSAMPRARLAHFEFRAVRPIFDGAPFDLCARDEPWGATLWARDGAGHLAMRAEARFAQGPAA